MTDSETQVVPNALASLSLRANFVWTFAGNLVYTGSQWGILVLLAKLSSPETVGRFALGLAVTAPVFMLTNFQLRAIQATDAKDDFRFGDYFALRLLMTVLAILIIVGAVVLGGYRRETAILILCIGLAKGFEAISDVAYGLMQKHERMDWIAISMMIKGPLSLAAMAGITWLTRDVIYGALAMAAVWAGLLLFYDLRNARRIDRIRPRFQSGILMRLTKLAIPLGVVMMLVSLNSNIPRYFLERVWGETELGYFSALAYLMLVGNTVVGALGQSATPRLAKDYATGDDRSFRRLLSRLVGIGVALGAFGVLIAVTMGRQVLTLLYRSDYAEHIDVFVWLMIVAAFNYVGSFMGYSMTAARYFRVQLPLFAGVAGVLTAACAVLIPRAGLTGAAQAMGIAAIVQLLGGLAINIHAVHALERYGAAVKVI